jgi:acylphosphatase
MSSADHGDDRVARELVVHGHVQGVFFRDGTQREAERRRVSGWAANRPDGTVEILLEGRASDVEEVIAYCARGPRGARVTELEVRELEPRGLTGFEIG